MIIVKTPLRISFVGGGSDIRDYYHHSDGKVVCTTIDKYVYAIVKERFDDLIYINYSQKEIVSRVDEIQHDLVREAMRMTGVEKGVEVTTLADIPSSGSGLGSSSSITVALLHAFYSFRNRLVTAEQLAQDACRIEIDIMGKPIGRQDQYAAAFGGVNRLVFTKGDQTRCEPLDIPMATKRKFASAVLLYFTGLTRSADPILTDMKANIQRDAKLDAMRQMVSLVDPFCEAMQEGDTARCGGMLAENWRIKKSLATGISNPQIDDMYNRAIEAGALAGKVTGAGGGGFLMLMVPRENQNRVFSALHAYRELPFMFEESGSKVIFDDRSYTSK